jgi:hypothetical protein
MKMGLVFYRRTWVANCRAAFESPNQTHNSHTHVRESFSIHAGSFRRLVDGVSADRLFVITLLTVNYTDRSAPESTYGKCRLIHKHQDIDWIGRRPLQLSLEEWIVPCPVEQFLRELA